MRCLRFSKAECEVSVKEEADSYDTSLGMGH